MQACPWNFLLDNKKHIISLVGGGGKTTIMYELAGVFAKQGKKVVCMTTTHILKHKQCYFDFQQGHCEIFSTIANSEPIYANSFRALEALWQQGKYAVVGEEETNSSKLVLPAPSMLKNILQSSELVLIESDGAKHLPCKLPAHHEPVLLQESDIVVAVVGLDALGKSLDEVCFRWQLGEKIFASSCNSLMDEPKLTQLLLSEQGARKNVGNRDFYIALNKCDLVEPKQALQMRELLQTQGIEPSKIWLRNLP